MSGIFLRNCALRLRATPPHTIASNTANSSDVIRADSSTFSERDNKFKELHVSNYTHISFLEKSETCKLN